MSSLRQIQANRLNARLSTGPITEEGKKRSRQNAVRHGLTAETVIGSLEDAEDYAAFELAVTSDYEAQTAVERELVLRLANLLWRLRRASTIETGLFELHVRQLLEFRRDRGGHRKPQQMIESVYRDAPDDHDINRGIDGSSSIESTSTSADASVSDDITGSFIRLTNLPTCPLDRLSRYEAALWRQACQIVFTLRCPDRRKPWQRSGLG